MRRSLAIIVTILVCLLVVALYWFLGKMQMNTAIARLDQEIAATEKKLDDLRIKKEEIGRLTAQLPVWLKQSQLFRKSIPDQVDDHLFFANLASELERYPDVTLLSIESVFGGPWLGEVKEDDALKLSELGIEPEIAAGIRVVFYSVKLKGRFDETLALFENLKKSQRLYTIDLISGPAIGGAGTISVNNQQESTPLQFSGRLYYNLPDPALNIDEIERLYFDAVSLRVHRALTDGADMVLEGETPAVEEPESPVDETVTEESTESPEENNDGSDTLTNTANAGTATGSRNSQTGTGLVALAAEGHSGIASQGKLR